MELSFTPPRASVLKFYLKHSLNVADLLVSLTCRQESGESCSFVRCLMFLGQIWCLLAGLRLPRYPWLLLAKFSDLIQKWEKSRFCLNQTYAIFSQLKRERVFRVKISQLYARNFLKDICCPIFVRPFAKHALQGVEAFY